jgi:Holliday junction resolvase
VNTARKGTAGELRVAAWLQKRGWLVASRRHVGGAGDLLAWKPGFPPRLIEVKAAGGSPWENFRPAERAELVKTAQQFGCEAFLALSPKAGIPIIVPSKDFP